MFLSYSYNRLLAETSRNDPERAAKEPEHFEIDLLSPPIGRLVSFTDSLRAVAPSSGSL